MEKTTVGQRTIEDYRKCIKFQGESLKKLTKIIKEKNDIIMEKEKEIHSLNFELKSCKRELTKLKWSKEQ